MFRIRTLTVLVVLAGGSYGGRSSVVMAAGPSDAEFDILIYKESRGNDWAIGDKRLKNKAYGPLQIRQPVCDDVNRRFGTRYRAQDCLGNRALSIKVARLYWSIYATRKRLGREPTTLDRAGIWNGGPNGWKSPKTAKYRGEFERLLLKKQKRK